MSISLDGENSILSANNIYLNISTILNYKFYEDSTHF